MPKDAKPFPKQAGIGRIQEVQANSQVNLRANHGRLRNHRSRPICLFDGPFIRPLRTVLPKIDSSAKPIVKIVAQLQVRFA